MDPMLYVKETVKTPQEVGRGLEAAAQKHKFGILTVHNLKETMKNKGVDMDMDCEVYEVCNPVQAKRVLEANPSISTVLPCRISVYREGGRTRLATFLPTEMLKLFNSPEVEPVAQEVERVMMAMMDEAAG
jgi:uncharacterized protein (DUF302 family)